MTDQETRALAKVPAVTLGFWIIKILATTLGETGGDTLSMSMGLGYLASTLVFAALLLVTVTAQILTKRFHPAFYWAAIIASTTTGTTLADFADRSLGFGYAGGAAALLAAALASLAVWFVVEKSISGEKVTTPRQEAFYWTTITLSQTLGTALGDWAADNEGLGYLGGAALFGGTLCVVAVLYFLTRAPRALLFWAAFILTRPLGATVGDFLDKPLAEGGLALSREWATGVLAISIVAGISLSWFLTRRKAVRAA